MAFKAEGVKTPAHDSSTARQAKQHKPTVELRYTQAMRQDPHLRIGGRTPSGDRDEQFYRWLDGPDGAFWRTLDSKDAKTHAMCWLQQHGKEEFTASKGKSCVDSALSVLSSETDQVVPQPPRSSAIVPIRGAYLHIDQDGTVRARTPDPAMGITHAVPVDIDPSRVDASGVYMPRPVDPQSAFGRYLDRFFPDPDVRLLLQEAVGSSVLPVTFELGFQLTGDGSNGKSTLLHLLRAIHPQNIGLSLQGLGKEFGYAGLAGKTLAICTEAPDFIGKEAEQCLKALISRDAVPMRGLYRDPVTVVPRCAVFFSVNNALKFQDHSYGMSSKIRNIPCTIKLDRGSPDRIPDYHLRITENPKEMQQVLDWLLEGAARLRRQGHRFTALPPALEGFARAERLRTDTVLRFLDEEHAVYDAAAWTAKQDIYRRYDEWCRERNLRPDGEGSFWDRARGAFPDTELKDKMLTRIGGKDGKRARCIQLRVDEVKVIKIDSAW